MNSLFWFYFQSYIFKIITYVITEIGILFLDILLEFFSCNQIVLKICLAIDFWATNPLIDEFY